MRHETCWLTLAFLIYFPSDIIFLSNDSIHEYFAVRTGEDGQKFLNLDTKAGEPLFPTFGYTYTLSSGYKRIVKRDIKTNLHIQPVSDYSA